MAKIIKAGNPPPITFYVVTCTYCQGIAEYAHTESTSVQRYANCQALEFQCPSCGGNVYGFGPGNPQQTNGDNDPAVLNVHEQLQNVQTAAPRTGILRWSGV